MSEPITNPYRGARRAHETTKEFSFRLAKELAYDDGTAAVLAALESSEAVRAAAKALTSPFNPNPREMEDEARAVLSAVVVHLRGGTDPPAQA